MEPSRIFCIIIVKALYGINGDVWYIFVSGVARAFPGGRSAHPEDQNEEENEERLRKNERSYKKMRKDWGNHPILPTQEWEAGYGPDLRFFQMKQMKILPVQWKNLYSAHTPGGGTP